MDDEEQFGKMTAMMLAHLGYHEAELVRDGAVGLARLAVFEFR